MTGKDVLKRFEQLEALRSPHEWLWNEIGYLTNTRYLNKSKGSATQGNIPHSEIYDTTLRTKSRMQANGITSMLFPRDRDWLRINPPWMMKSNKSAQKKYREAGEGVIHYLRASNFHHQNHGVITHRSQLGTGTMIMEWMVNDNGGEEMNFRRMEPMSYLINHDARSKVQTFSCEYNWTASQAANEWGLKNLSAKLQKEAQDINKQNEFHSFIMLIEKRPSWEVDSSKGNQGQAYRVLVIERDGESIVLDSGNDTFQVIASRYEVGDSPWGYSPAWEILPDAYKANFAAKFMMVMGERAAVPPVIAPASMKEEGIGLGAAEVTYVSDLNPNAWPKELSSGANYNVGMDVWKLLRDSIDEAYHGNLFNMFSRQQRDRTATEITAMQGELNSQPDPTITALTQDHTEPVVKWAFEGLAERGDIDLPEEAYDEESGKPHLPTFAYDNAITMNHRRGKAIEAMGIIDGMMNLKQLGAQVDVVQLDEVARRIWRDQGQDEDELYSEQEFQKKAEEEEARQEQAQQMQMLEQGANAIGKSGIDPQQLSQMAG